MNDSFRRWLPWALLALAVIVTAIVYWPGVTGGWVFDDYPNIVDNAAIHIQAGHATLVAWLNAALSSPASFLHRPLASITFAANWMQGGGNPYPFKVTNIAIHLLNGVLVFCMLRALLRLLAFRANGGFAPMAGGSRPALRAPGTEADGLERSMAGGSRPALRAPGTERDDLGRSTVGGSRPALRGVDGAVSPVVDDAAATRLALIVAAAWMLLPINLMAVLYVVQRMESLCQVFVLAGLWAYLHGRWMMLTATSRGRDWRGLALAVCGLVFGTLLGLTSKETAVLLPLFCFFAEWIVVRFARAPATLENRGDPAAARSAEPAATAANLSGHSAAARSAEPAATAANLSGHSGAARSAEPGIYSSSEADDPKNWIPGSIADGAGDGPGMTKNAGSIAGFAGDGPGMTNQENNGHAAAARSAEPAATAANLSGQSGAARSAEPGFHASREADDSNSWIPGSIADAAGDGPGMTNEGELHAAGPTGAISGHHGGAGHGRRPYPDGAGSAKQDFRLWAMFIVTLFIPAILGFLWLLRGALRPAALAGRDFTLGQRLLTEPRVLVDYLHWTLFPNPEVLSLYHDEIKVSTGILAPGTTLGAMLVLAALVVIAVWLRNRRPLVSLGIAWFFGAQLLTATIIPLELVYEQRMYFASIGVLLAVAARLMGLRWRIRLPLLRGFIVGVALLWFALATNLRAQEWSNPIRLAVAEANRHPESPRAVYEAGRLLLIASNYAPGKARDASEKYLREASRIPGASTLPDQALIMLVDHEHQGDDAAYWASMAHKLADQPTRQEDISALISLTNCYGAGICKFDPANLNRAYQAALSRPFPIARLNGAYADFQRDIFHDDKLAIEYLARAVKGAPSESAYRMDLAALYARNGQIENAQAQIAALKRMNFAGRLDGQITTLERMVEQARATDPAAH